MSDNSLKAFCALCGDCQGMGLPHSQNSTLSFSVAWDGHLLVALCASGPLDGHSPCSPGDIFDTSCIQSGETLFLGLLDGHSPSSPGDIVFFNWIQNGDTLSFGQSDRHSPPFPSDMFDLGCILSGETTFCRKISRYSLCPRQKDTACIQNPLIQAALPSQYL